MKANEFVKKFGWEKSKEVVNYRDNHAERTHVYKFNKSCVDSSVLKSGAYLYTESYNEYAVNVDDLKRLVESWELVQVGLPELKKAMFSDSKDLEYVKNWLLTVSEKLLTEKGIKLKQAIADVESCL